MTRLPLILVTLTVLGCGSGIVGGGDEPFSASPDPSTDTPGAPTPNNPSPNNPAPLSGCQTDADCLAPNVCNTAAGKCVSPAAKNNSPCDPIEGADCPTGQQCLSGVCMPPPGGCVTNDECPAGFLCISGVCKPDSNGQTGCLTDVNCPSGQICINGDCKPKGVCNIPHALDRMKGNWKLDSMLHVRDGLQGFTKGLLSVATTMQSIIDGKFSISGLPSVLTDIIAGILQNLIQQYVPAWGKQVIKLLATVDDVIDDTRVVSVEHLQPLGNDMYTGSSTWQLVEFEFQGVKVAKAPQNIPGVGPVTTTSYTAREVCGVLFIDQHKVKNSVGQIYRWAIEALITAISCSMNNVPCYTNINAMFNDLIDCPKLAAAVADQNAFPGLGPAVLAACQAEKQSLIQLLIQELNDLAVNMTYMSLKAKADILNANSMVNGKWYGVLGGTYGYGNFEGAFTGVRMP